MPGEKVQCQETIQAVDAGFNVDRGALAKMMAKNVANIGHHARGRWIDLQNARPRRAISTAQQPSDRMAHPSTRQIGQIQLRNFRGINWGGAKTIQLANHLLDLLLDVRKSLPNGCACSVASCHGAGRDEIRRGFVVGIDSLLNPDGRLGQLAQFSGERGGDGKFRQITHLKIDGRVNCRQKTLGGGRIEDCQHARHIVGKEWRDPATSKTSCRFQVSPPGTETAAGEVGPCDPAAAVVAGVFRDPLPLAVQVGVAIDDRLLDFPAIVLPIDLVLPRASYSSAA